MARRMKRYGGRKSGDNPPRQGGRPKPPRAISKASRRPSPRPAPRPAGSARQLADERLEKPGRTFVVELELGGERIAVELHGRKMPGEAAACTGRYLNNVTDEQVAVQKGDPLPPSPQGSGWYLLPRRIVKLIDGAAGTRAAQPGAGDEPAETAPPSPQPEQEER